MSEANTLEVFHYISAKWGVEALSRGRLKLATLEDMNDPFELRAFNTGAKELRKFINDRRDIANSQIGFLCFCPTWQNSIMWSHYADRHRGMVLGFRVSSARLFEIPYIKDRLDFFGEAGKSSSRTDNFTTRQFAKHESWAYEQENRLVVNLVDRQPENEMYFCEFGDELKLSSIYLGERFSASEVEVRALSSVREAKIEPIQTRLAFKSFEVVKQRLTRSHKSRGQAL
tara:strand:+ start:561 stop:1247 length:687 start_codon:yes stop_codon:yes gene_type:complete